MRLAAIAVFGMVFAYIQILSNLTHPYANLFGFLYATSIPLLTAMLIVLPIHRLQEHLLQKAN